MMANVLAFQTLVRADTGVRQRQSSLSLQTKAASEMIPQVTKLLLKKKRAKQNLSPRSDGLSA